MVEGGLRCTWGMGYGGGWFAVHLGMGCSGGWFTVRLSDGTWKRVVYGASERWDVEEGGLRCV